MIAAATKRRLTNMVTLGKLEKDPFSPDQVYPMAGYTARSENRRVEFSSHLHPQLGALVYGTICMASMVTPIGTIC